MSETCMMLLSNFQVAKMYACVPRSAINTFVELCLNCHVRKPQAATAPLRPIISSGFMTRRQVC